MDRLKRTAFVVLGIGLWGCGPTIVLDDDTESAGDDTTSSSTGVIEPPNPVTTTPPPPPPPTGTTTEAADSSTTEPGIEFIPEPDGVVGDECDLWLQDCPRGDKCMPWANDGGNSWNAWRCSPIADNPGVRGDPCTVEGSPVSGVDDCELGAICWDVDPMTLEGRCIDLCVGDEVSPTCEHPQDICHIPGNGILPLCLASCDPLLQDCNAGQACVEAGGSFTCVPDASGDEGVAGDPCEFINSCDPGNFCASGMFVPGCATSGCCTAFCDLSDPMPPCLPEQVCIPYYEEGSAPPGFELVGACALP